MVRLSAPSRVQAAVHPLYSIIYNFSFPFRGLRTLISLPNKRQRVALLAVGCLSSLGVPLFRVNSPRQPLQLPAHAVINVFLISFRGLPTSDAPGVLLSVRGSLVVRLRLRNRPCTRLRLRAHLAVNGLTFFFECSHGPRGLRYRGFLTHGVAPFDSSSLTGRRFLGRSVASWQRLSILAI